MSQTKIIQREEDIPALAEQAVRNAVTSAIAAGRSVLVTQDELVFEVFPDGTKELLTHILPRTHVDASFVRVLPQ